MDAKILFSLYKKPTFFTKKPIALMFEYRKTTKRNFTKGLKYSHCSQTFCELNLLPVNLL